MASLENIVSEQIRNPHDAEMVMQTLIPVLLVAALIVGGLIFAFVVRSVDKDAKKDKAPPKGKP
jgi:hypothetical protein